jgi:hypothetical protein
LDDGLLRLDEFHCVCGEIGGDNLPGMLRFGLKLFREDDHEGSGYKIIVHGDNPFDRKAAIPKETNNGSKSSDQEEEDEVRQVM